MRVWNAAFASLQVAIGVGLIWGRGRTVDWARGISVLWALGVWTIGEGVGGMFMGGTSLLTGAPGAALLYAVIAVVIWPPRIRVGGGPPGLGGRRGSGRRCWSSQATNHAARGAGDPDRQRPLRRALVGRGRSIGRSGTLLAGGGPRRRRPGGGGGVRRHGSALSRTRVAALATGVAVAGFVGLAGQDLGGVLTGQGTDPGTGPLLILLAIALWPASAARRATGAACRRKEAEAEGELLAARDLDRDPAAGLDPVRGPAGRGRRTPTRTRAASQGCNGRGPRPVRAPGSPPRPGRRSGSPAGPGAATIPELPSTW